MAAAPVPKVTSRGTEWVTVGALVLAIVQLPVVALWLIGVSSPWYPPTVIVAPSVAQHVTTPARPVSIPDIGNTPKVADRVALEAAVLHVETQPSGVRVSVDGAFRGRSPLTLDALAGGSHTVVVRFGTRAIERVVDLQPGRNVSLVVAGPDDIPATGTVRVEGAIPLQVYLDDRLLGSSESGALVLPVGDHTLDIRDDRLGFRVQQSVRVRAGATTPVRIDLPRAPIFVDAQPWADVWIDGTPVGTTPLSSLRWTIGRHQVRVRHPELGERTATLLVTLDEPARLSIDLRNE